jgi:hypothetical protein
MESKQMDVQQPKYAVPIGLNFRLGIADSIPATHNISQFLASNASDFTESNNTIRINVSSGGFLDLRKAVLEFDLKNTTSTDAVYLDGGAECVINRIRILSSDGSEIERIDQYGQLASVLDQYTSSGGASRIKSIQKGSPKFVDETASFDEVSGASGAAALTATASAQAYESGIKVECVNTYTGSTGQSTVKVSGNGGVGYSQLQCDKLNADVTRKYSFGLKCGFFNPSTAKLLPPNTPFQVEITLGKGAECLVNKAGSNAVSYQLNNAELHIPTIVVNDPEYMASVNARLGAGVSYKCNSYNHFVNTTASGAGKDTIQISARARSLKGLMSILRKQSKVSSDDDFKLSKRTIQYVSDYQYKINSTNYPVDRVNISTDTTAGGTASGTRLPLSSTDNLNVSESFNHAMRLMGGLNSSNADCLIGLESFAQSENANNNGTGILAIDLSAFSDGSVNSGINTLNNGVVQLEFTKTSACNAIVQVDTYSIHELIVMRSPSGILQSMY